MLNNYDWFKNFSWLDFLRDVGKSFRIGPMLAKDSVKRRLESEEGLSFTEFCYQILQGYDFFHLYLNHQVTLQIGGSDQWGNITAGTEFIRKMSGQQAFGLTFPLLVKSDGQKYGKSEKGAVWLSPHKLSPYEFYQFLIRTADADVINLLRMLTFLPMDEINEIKRRMQSADYAPNTAQKLLAREVTSLVHGEDSLQKAVQATAIAAPGSSAVLNAADLEQIALDIPATQLKLEDIIHHKLIDFIVLVGMLPSKSEAKKMVNNGGVYINNQKVDSLERVLLAKDLVEGRLMLLGIGKKNKMLIRVLNLS
jgi:tyrosyl-tRNA synthetase